MSSFWHFDTGRTIDENFVKMKYTVDYMASSATMSFAWQIIYPGLQIIEMYGNIFSFATWGSG